MIAAKDLAHRHRRLRRRHGHPAHSPLRKRVRGGCPRGEPARFRCSRITSGSQTPRGTIPARGKSSRWRRWTKVLMSFRRRGQLGPRRV
jgi:hypothetical protein